MGKRTSDFMALTVILSGAGLGLGLTGLFARTAQVDDASVEVQIVPGRVMVRHRSADPTIYFRSRVGMYRYDRAPSERFRIEIEERRHIEEGSDREELERLMIQVQERLREAREAREFEAMFVTDGLKEVMEILDDLDGDLTMTLDVLQSANDGDEQRRRRRRRRPRRVAEVPDSDAPGN